MSGGYFGEAWGMRSSERETIASTHHPICGVGQSFSNASLDSRQPLLLVPVLSKKILAAWATCQQVPRYE